MNNNSYFGTGVPADQLQRQLSAQHEQQQRELEQQQQAQQQRMSEQHRRQQQQLQQQQQQQQQLEQQQHFRQQTSLDNHQRRRQQLSNLGSLQVGGMTMDDSRRQHGQQDSMSAISNSPMLDGDSLDDIIRDNSNEMRRRQSLTQPYSPNELDHSARRLSLMDFGSNSDAFRNFDFDGVTDAFGVMGNTGMGAGMGQYSQPENNVDMMGMSNGGNFSTLSPEMMGSMLAFSSLNMNPSTTGPDNMGLFSPTGLGDQYMGNTGINMDGTNTDDFSMDMLTDNSMPPPDSATTAMVRRNDGDSDMMNSGQQQQQQELQDQDQQQQQQKHQQQQHQQKHQQQQQQQKHQQQQQQQQFFARVNEPLQAQEQQGIGTQAPTASAGDSQNTPLPETFKDNGVPAVAPGPSTKQDPPGLHAPAQPMGPSAPAKSVYSKSGFDMVRALYYVATRENPQIQLGAVDMSCAFVVTDISLNDCPIVYVSSNFQNLTGYSQHEILGKNCRFLQAPDGQVEAGIKREFVEDHAVFNLKKAIAERKEIQQSLINYRKGGKPFLNLLTMIPIPWDSQEMRYYVGFQIDIVECPDAIAKQGMGGQMQVNYKNSDIGHYIWNGPATGAGAGGGASMGGSALASEQQDSSQTLSADDVSTLLKQIKPKGVASDWHRQAWDKMLLENADDVVHVLTPKGAFQYLSPSCKKVLGYDAAELVGPNSNKNTLTSICHPSDLISVTRELKDASPTNPTVNMAFRIQQKKKGYAWFESYGSLFVEAGKGRKFIVLVGRKRPVFTLRKKDVEAQGGIGDSELWTKLSVSGMFLFVSSNIRSLLDLQPQDLLGTSIQELMRKESRPEFGRTIEKARKGKIVSCKHEVQNRRGQVLQAQTTLYPGDSSEEPGRKASFLLAQTKLVKAASRSSASASSLSGSAVGKKSGGQVLDLKGPNGSAVGAAATASSEDAKSSAARSAGGSTPTGTYKDSNNTNSTSATPASTSADTGADKTPGGGGMPQTYAQLDDNMFEELNTTRCTSWQYELHQMEKVNRLLAEELGQLLSNRKKRKRRRSAGLVRDCANCHTRSTPEWRRGPSGQRDLCNSCGLRWAKQIGRVSPRTSSRGGNKEDAQSRKSNSPSHQSPLQREYSNDSSTSATHKIRVKSDQSPPAPSGTAGGKTMNLADAVAAAVGVETTGPSSNLSMTSFPPPSNPLLEGGSGLGGSGMGMTSIREERET